MVCRSAASLLSGYYNGCCSWQLLEFNLNIDKKITVRDYSAWDSITNY